MTNEVKKENYFKAECKHYLMQLSITDLRAYGRFLKLQKPTCLKKEDLVEEIITVLNGEKKPTRKSVGAPIKNRFFPKEIVLRVEEIKREILGEEGRREPTKEMEKINTKNKEVPLLITLSIDLEKLNEKQKRCLKAFLDSLVMEK